MDIKKSLKRILVFAFSCIVAAFPLVLYLFLLNKSCANSLMYSADKLWTVIIISVLCGGIVWLTLKRPIYRGEVSMLGEEEAEGDIFDEKELEEAPVYDNSAAMEEYPELFMKEKVKADSENGAPSYYEALSEVIASEKREYAPEEKEGGAEILSAREILATEENSENENTESFQRDMSIYENIPMDLPEGYVSAKVYDPKEDELLQDDEDEGEYETKVRRFPGETVLSKVIITVVFTLVAFLSAFLFSTEYTLYEKDSVTVSTFGKEVTYSFEEAVEYIVSPSFFGDRLSVEVVMKDGEKIELLSSGQFVGEKFFREFDSIYEYGAYVCEKMNDNGAKKTVLERKTIEGEFIGTGSETEECIKKIID